MNAAPNTATLSTAANRGIVSGRSRSDTAGDTILEPAAVPAASMYLPQSVAGVFDEAFDVYKRNFLIIAVIVALIYVPTQFVLHIAATTYLRPLAASLSGRNDDAQIGTGFLLFLGYFLTGNPEYAVPGFLSLTALALAGGPVAVAVSDIFEGRVPDVRTAYARAWRVMMRLFSVLVTVVVTCVGVLIGGVFVVTILLSLVVGLAQAVFGSLIQVIPEELLAALGIAVSLTPYLACCAVIARSYLFAIPLITLENVEVGGVAARNSLLVGKTRFRRIWAAAIFLPLIVFGLQSLMLMAIGGTIEGFHLPPVWAFLLQGASFTLISFFFQPYWMVFVTLLYYDARIRREGMDVRMMGAYLPVFDPLTPTTEQPAAPLQPGPPAFAPPPMPPVFAPMPPISGPPPTAQRPLTGGPLP